MTDAELQIKLLTLEQNFKIRKNKMQRKIDEVMIMARNQIYENSKTRSQLFTSVNNIIE